MSPSGGLPPLPRPGPDPLPWPEAISPPHATARWLGIALAAALILTLVVRALVRQRRAARSRSAVPALPPPGASLEALADAVRSALVAVWGASWAARTTEEIDASRAVLEAVFGRELTDRLLAFLRAADRARFAGRDVPAEDWRPVVEAVLDGARSITTGR